MDLIVLEWGFLWSRMPIFFLFSWKHQRTWVVKDHSQNNGDCRFCRIDHGNQVFHLRDAILNGVDLDKLLGYESKALKENPV